MSPSNNTLDGFVQERKTYTNTHGVTFFWVEGKSFLRVSCEVKVRSGSDGSTLVLYKHFDEKVSTILLFFGFTWIEQIDTIDQQLLWKLFREGRFFMACLVNNHPFSLSIPGGTEGTEIEITSEDGSGEFVKYELPREVFLTENDYLNCCSFVYPELMKAKQSHFWGIGGIVKKCLEWVIGK